MNKPNPYINSFYLLVHLMLNILVVALVLDVINAFVPIKHLFAGYHLNNINLSSIYPPSTLQKNLAAAVAVGAAIWYYKKKKAKGGDTPYKYHLPNLHQLEEFFRSKF